ncbi:MAG: hypothetical protein V4534_04430 [Myxococcota bacterium]
MPHLFLFVLLWANLGQAALVNQTQVRLCALQAFNQTDADLSACLANAEIRSKTPLSCYLATAADETFLAALYTSVALLSASIAIPALGIGLSALAKRHNCCLGCANCNDALANAEPTTIPITPGSPLQQIMSLTTTRVSTIVSLSFTCISASWLFPLWETRKKTEATCAHDLVS